MNKLILKCMGIRFRFIIESGRTTQAHGFEKAREVSGISSGTHFFSGEHTFIFTILLFKF